MSEVTTSPTPAAEANSDRLRNFLKAPQNPVAAAPVAAAPVEAEAVEAAPETPVAAAPAPVAAAPVAPPVERPVAAKPAAPAKPATTESAMERMRKLTSSGGGGGAASTVEDPDEGATIAASDIDDFWEVGWHFVEIVSAERTLSKSSGAKMFKVCYRGLAGAMQGSYKTDYWLLEGKGVKKTGRAAASVGMRDPVSGDVKIPSGQALVAKRLWIEVIHKEEPYDRGDGTPPIITTKDEIRFPDGYRPESAFAVPQAGDLFSEGPIKTA